MLRQALDSKIAENRRLRGVGMLIQNAAAAALTRLPPLTLPPAPKTPHTLKRGEEIAMLHISDTQIGKVTTSYNSKVAVERLRELAEKTIRITEVRRAAANIDEIHVALGGDMVEGECIFPHQAHLIDQSVYDQALLTTPYALAEVIMMLLRVFKRVKVFGVVGNHGRTMPKDEGAHPRSNWDRVVYTTLKHLFFGPPSAPRKDPELKRLEIVVPDEFSYVDRIYEWGLLFVHGHQIRGGGGGGFPYTGTTKKVGGWADAIRDPWDYLYFGHFHNYTQGTISTRTWYCNGTTESDNDYACEELAVVGFPMQRLQFFNASHGMISDNPIYLDHDHVPQLRRMRVR